MSTSSPLVFFSTILQVARLALWTSSFSQFLRQLYCELCQRTFPNDPPVFLFSRRCWDDWKSVWHFTLGHNVKVWWELSKESSSRSKTLCLHNELLLLLLFFLFSFRRHKVRVACSILARPPLFAGVLLALSVKSESCSYSRIGDWRAKDTDIARVWVLLVFSSMAQ